jgi:pimeloyl-ACP methyl ester carboxylesterase
MTVLAMSRLRVDFVEAGSRGPLVVLVHSTVSGARQWRKLMDTLQDRFWMRAVNLYGYGATPPWPGDSLQSLDDQADLIDAAIPDSADEVFLVGHSFGGAVAMKAAARLGARVSKLALIEPIPFTLLEQGGCTDALAEVVALRDWIKTFGARGEWATAARRFADYWSGTGTWQAITPERQAMFAQALRPNFFEWDTILGETTTAEGWGLLLPRRTMLLYDPATVLPVRQITDILQRACPEWTFVGLPGAGHMAPLTRPDLVNPLVADFLTRAPG